MKKIVVVFACSTLMAGCFDYKEDNVSEESTERMVEQCSDRVFPLQEELNEMQEPASGEILFPNDLKAEFARVLANCLAITRFLIDKTFVEFGQDKNGTECITVAKELRTAVAKAKTGFAKFEAANVNTKEGREEAYAGAGFLPLSLVLLHGKAILNYDVNCKLSF